MTRGRARAIRRIVPGGSERKVRELYEEVMGAVPAASVPVERVRASIIEALDELDERSGT